MMRMGRHDLSRWRTVIEYAEVNLRKSKEGTRSKRKQKPTKERETKERKANRKSRNKQRQR
jgi:hypothetical protein